MYAGCRSRRDPRRSQNSAALSLARPDLGGHQRCAQVADLSRTGARCWLLVLFDAIRPRSRRGFGRHKAIYIALGILPDGTKEFLGLWIEQTEGRRVLLRVMNELKNRGLQDVPIAVVDGLKAFLKTSMRLLRRRPADLHRSPGPPSMDGAAGIIQDDRAGASGRLSRADAEIGRPPRCLRAKSYGEKYPASRRAAPRSDLSVRSSQVPRAGGRSCTRQRTPSRR